MNLATQNKAVFLAGWGAAFIVFGIFSPSLGAIIGGAVTLAFAAFLHLLVSLTSASPHKVDPWQLQRGLMAISGQHTPPMPTLTKGSLMYFGLILEESAEMAHNLRIALAQTVAAGRMSHEQAVKVDGLLQTLAWAHVNIEQVRTQLRTQLMSVNEADVHAVLPLDLAKKLLDDAGDVMTVTAGFSLSTGLPGPEGYTEVTASNYSKKNPVTGVIDKEPTGKWIKGPDYFEPDLVKVLNQQWDRYEQNRPDGVQA